MIFKKEAYFGPKISIPFSCINKLMFTSLSKTTKILKACSSFFVPFLKLWREPIASISLQKYEMVDCD
jgi:hypothetical protein